MPRIACLPKLTANLLRTSSISSWPSLVWQILSKPQRDLPTARFVRQGMRHLDTTCMCRGVSEEIECSPYRWSSSCLLYTSDAADEEDSVDLGGRRIIKK